MINSRTRRYASMRLKFLANQKQRLEDEKSSSRSSTHQISILNQIAEVEGAIKEIKYILDL